MRIHPSAIIDSQADLADDVEVGPYTVITGKVTIDAGTRIGPHVVIKGDTHLGKHNQIFQFSSVGEDCQDLKYQGEPTRLHLGDHNIIREGCTLHRGTASDKGITRIGDHNLLMANVHIAHDCVVHNHIIIANNAALAGHVEVDDYAVLGGFVGVHQFCRVGAYAMLGVGSVVLKDVPAYMLVSGNIATPHGINNVGLKRRGFDEECRQHLRWAYKVIYRQGHSLEQAVTIIRGRLPQCPELARLLDSLKTMRRGLIR